MTCTSNKPLQLMESISANRRQLAAQSPQAFAKVYLGEACSKPFSSMHKTLFEELDRIVECRNSRLAVAAPRGHAKSTIVSLAFVLWCLLYEKEKLILLVSATQAQAIALLKHVKDELTRNDLLQRDFPGLCRRESGSGVRQPKPWRDNRIALPNGCMVCAYGTYQGLRGARNGPHRPGLIIVDDIEDPEAVISEDQRLKLWEWFRRTLLHAGHTGTNAIVVGTVLHHDSLLARITNPSNAIGWQPHKFKAVLAFSPRPELWQKWAQIFRSQEEYEGQTGEDAARSFYGANKDSMLEGTDVLWPDHESYYDLMLMQEREGRASFQAEKQNEPIDPEQCIFTEESFRYWDDDYPDEQSLIDELGPTVKIYGACDPSLGTRTGKGDYSGIVILASDRKTKINYVIAADMARRSPDHTIERILEYAKMYPSLRHFGVEGNHFQQLMIDNLKQRARERYIDLNVYKIDSRGNKQSRIANLEPAVAQGYLRFNRRHHLLLDQLRQFPFASHDDGPDALEMAIATSEQYRNTVYCRPF